MGPYELPGNIVLILERLKIPYLVTGSIASMAYGEPRLTNDIDIGDDVDYGYISEWAERLGLTEIWKAINDRISMEM